GARRRRAPRTSQGHSAASEASLTHPCGRKGGEWSRRSSSYSPRRRRAPAASEPVRLGRSLVAGDRLTHPPSAGSRPCLTNPRDGGCASRAWPLRCQSSENGVRGRSPRQTPPEEEAASQPPPSL